MFRSGRVGIERERKISGNENVCVFVRGYSSAGSLFVKYFRSENIGLQRRLLGKGAECGRKAFCWMEWGLGRREA